MTDAQRTGSQRVARGQRAQAALDEFVGPSVDAAVAAYLGRIKAIVSNEPWASEKVKALMIAARIAEEVRAQLAAFVEDGKLAASEREAVRRVEAMPDARRRWL